VTTLDFHKLGYCKSHMESVAAAQGQAMHGCTPASAKISKIFRDLLF